jgi:hypothetical protein
LILAVAGALATLSRTGMAAGDSGALPGGGGISVSGASGDPTPAAQRDGKVIVADAADEPFLLAQAAPGAPVSGGGATAVDPSLWSAIRWNLGPVNWGWSGVLGLNYVVRDFVGTRSNTFSGNLGLSLLGRSFIWQPWFIQLEGQLGVSLSYYDQSFDSEDFSRFSQNFNETNTVNPYGSASVQVFPFSRFPFQAYVQKSNSTTSGQLFDQDYDSLRYGLRQSYTPAQGGQFYGLSYDHSDIDTTNANILGVIEPIRDTLDVLRFDGSYSRPNHALSYGLEWDWNDRTDGFSAEQAFGFGQHSWAVSPQLLVNSDASYRRFKSSQEPRPFGLRVRRESDLDFAQFGTVATWRAAQLPLTVFGSLRGTYTKNEQSTDSAGLSNELTQGTGSLAATYQYTRNLRFDGNFSVTVSDDENTDATTNLLATATYNADTINLGAWQYYWSVFGSGQNQTGDRSGSAFTAGFAQNGLRPLGTLGGGQLTLNLFQNVSTTAASGDLASITNLGNVASLNWGLGYSAGSMSAGITLSDQRTFGDEEQDFQQVNVQFNADGQITRYSRWTGNITYQANWQRFDERLDDRFAVTDPFSFSRSRRTDSWYLNANLSYQHARVFGVPRLQFTSTFQTFDYQPTRSEGNLVLNTPDGELTWRWDNRLLYFIGKTELELGAQFNRIELGSSTADEWLVGVRLVRRLGSY